MTSHFIDLTVVPDPETGAPQLLSVLFDRLHLLLVQHRIESIGVSFPGYIINPRALGNTLRLHGDERHLLEVSQADWLKGLRDHVRLTGVAPVPEGATHRTVRRKQFKTNADRLRRRRMQRKNETAEQAALAIPASVERRPDLPYLHVRSRSSGQPFCLFIALGPEAGQPTPGSFNSYGLGGPATVPWF